AAIKISNKFSGMAGQFAWAATAPFANASFAIPARATGFLGRNTIGRGSQWVSNELLQAARNRKDGSFAQGLLYGSSKAFEKPAKADYNVGNWTNNKMAQS